MNEFQQIKAFLYACLPSEAIPDWAHIVVLLTAIAERQQAEIDLLRECQSRTEQRVGDMAGTVYGR